MAKAQNNREDRYCVYRMYSADDELLYVGKSLSIERRLKDHHRERPFWSEVRRIEVDHYWEAWEMDRAEADALQALTPKYNVVLGLQPTNGGTFPTLSMREFCILITCDEQLVFQMLVEGLPHRWVKDVLRFPRNEALAWLADDLAHWQGVHIERTREVASA